MNRGIAALSALRWILMFSGLVALGYCGYVYADTALYQKYETWAFDEELHGRTPSFGGFLVNSTPLTRLFRQAPGTEKTQGPAAPRPSGLVENAVIGRIEIPRLKIQAIVREGEDDSTLRRSVGHIPSSALPGQTGNVGLAGHRDTFFRGLRNARKNDRIEIRTLDGEYEYVVDSLRIVTPEDVQVLAPTADNVLTLVTCYPFNYVGNAPKRYIVRARQVRGISTTAKALAHGAASASSSTP